MEIAASAGIVGDQFWNCTVEEVLAAHKGRVMEWRVFRLHAYQLALAHGTIKNPPSKEQMFPLPYDDEETKDVGYDIEEFYKNATHGWQ